MGEARKEERRREGEGKFGLRKENGTRVNKGMALEFKN